MKFEIKGEFDLGNKTQEFLREVEADSENLAVEKLYCLLGSSHGLRRAEIAINKIKNL